ncbi:hypothetical protein A3Q56_08591, partial [Intoshia linei]
RNKSKQLKFNGLIRAYIINDEVGEIEFIDGVQEKPTSLLDISVSLTSASQEKKYFIKFKLDDKYNFSSKIHISIHDSNTEFKIVAIKHDGNICFRDYSVCLLKLSPFIQVVYLSL